MIIVDGFPFDIISPITRSDRNENLRHIIASNIWTSSCAFVTDHVIVASRVCKDDSVEIECWEITLPVLQ